MKVKRGALQTGAERGCRPMCPAAHNTTLPHDVAAAALDGSGVYGASRKHEQTSLPDETATKTKQGGQNCKWEAIRE